MFAMSLSSSVLHFMKNISCWFLSHASTLSFRTPGNRSHFGGMQFIEVSAPLPKWAGLFELH